MKVIDKLSCPIDYDCRKCKSYHPMKINNIHATFCVKDKDNYVIYESSLIGNRMKKMDDERSNPDEFKFEICLYCYDYQPSLLDKK